MVNSEEGSTERRFTLEELIAPTELVIPEPPAAIGVGKEGEPRLMIKQIVNENFKSYAGRKIIGPFHKAFTSIVGPNGSGKSNVIDSMLFVFGYRAQKIRSKKVSVLIHNSEKHVNLRSCTVEVHFHMIVDKEGENEYDVIPGSEIVVSRTAFKDNSSYYSIDGRKTNFKEVSTLLKGKGIDLVHNRFLILQGEVEQISQMKPKAENPNEEGMLEYLEDIIGSSRLKPLIDTLNVKVEQLDVYRTEKNNRVKLAEEEMKKLEGGYEEAKKYLELKNRHTRNQNVIFQSQVFAKNNHIRKLEEDQVTVSEKISELQTKQNDFVAENKEIFKAHAKAKKKVGKIENTVNQLSDKKGEMESKNTILNEELKQKKTRKKKLGGEMEKAQKKVEEFTAMPEKCEHEQNELNEKLEDLKAAEIRQESQLQEVISSVEKETTELRKKKEPLEKKLMKIEESANEKNQILSEHKAIIANYTETHTRAKENLKKFKDDITAAEEKVVGLETEKDQLEENIPQMENDEHEKTAQVAKMQDERVATQEKLAQLQSKLNDAKESGGDAKQKHQVFEYIMGLKRAKRVPGIIGRLGDLGGIPKKFDVALSSSCGMDVMIVEKSEQAKDIVELMKKDRAGACTFFALDKLQPFREADRNLPGPRLVDEIWTEDERLKKAFYKACGNTLYADNISIARKMGNSGGQRHRVVSLDGSVVEPTGTFTGGGSRKMSGAMAEKPQIQVNKETISDDEIREMEDGVNELRDQIRNFDFEIRKLNGEIAQLRKQLQKSKERLKLIASEYETASERIKLLQARIKPAEKEVKDTEPDKKELRKLEDELKDAEVEYGATKAQADEARSEVDDLNKQIGEKGKGKIETIKKNIKKTKKDIADTNKKILKVQNDAKTAERNRNKAEMDVQRLADEEKELKERVEAIKAETDKLVEEFTEVEADLKEVKELLDGAKIHEAECQKNSSEMEKQIETLTNELQKFKSTQKENTSKINELQGLIRDLKKRLERLTIEQIDIEDDLTIATLTEEEFGEVDLPALILASEQMKAELDQNRPNLGALQEYRTRQKVYLERQKEYNAINDARNAKREVRNDLMKRRHSEFMEGFDLITNKVKQMYQMITLGGDAELELVNSLAPFDDGVSFTVRPPKKSWKNIMNLSGGEKTLSSLALVFALHHYKPTPLYVMDEIDAALDIKNVSIIANYIKDRTKNAQFIIISLRNQMFCLASRLCGIYKTNNCTKMVVVTNRRPEDEKENEATGPSKTISVRSPMKPSILSQSQMDQN